MEGNTRQLAAALEATCAFRLRVTAALAPEPPSRADVASLVCNHEAMYDTGAGCLEARDELLSVKKLLDAVEPAKYYTARDSIFPLAHSGVQDHRAKFQNRAGYKLNQVMECSHTWDAVLASPVQEQASPAEGIDDAVVKDAPATRRRRHFAFVDICGGPGAFSQAIFQCVPKGTLAKGFGLTLLDRHVGADAGWYPALTAKKNFVPCFGIDGTGDIYNSANVEAFVSVVGGGVCQLAVADGGFEVAPAQMGIQEALSARIVYSQWYVALRTLAPGGCFVLKLFDTFTAFTRSLLYLSCAWFDSVEIVKPLHSRAVNSERYLSCNGFRGVPLAWQEALRGVHSVGFSSSGAIRQLVSDAVMNSDATFTESVDASVRVIARTQCDALNLVLSSPMITTPAAVEAPPAAATTATEGAAS